MDLGDRSGLDKVNLVIAARIIWPGTFNIFDLWAENSKRNGTRVGVGNIEHSQSGMVGGICVATKSDLQRLQYFWQRLRSGGENQRQNRNCCETKTG